MRTSGKCAISRLLTCQRPKLTQIAPAAGASLVGGVTCVAAIVVWTLILICNSRRVRACHKELWHLAGALRHIATWKALNYHACCAGATQASRAHNSQWDALVTWWLYLAS
jgi:hypothetical protein